MVAQPRCLACRAERDERGLSPGQMFAIGMVIGAMQEHRPPEEKRGSLCERHAKLEPVRAVVSHWKKDDEP